MRGRRRVAIGIGVIAAAVVLVGAVIRQVPPAAAGGLLRPARHRLQQPIPENCKEMFEFPYC
ncbi:MAG TPA: hypothetical protein VJM31_01035 [Vicinamibacterales bacterium]|nr:hypothetical protein [Vicinamibacterales bacterium]